MLVCNSMWFCLKLRLVVIVKREKQYNRLLKNRLIYLVNT